MFDDTEDFKFFLTIGLALLIVAGGFLLQHHVEPRCTFARDFDVCVKVMQMEDKNASGSTVPAKHV